jgi:hypothetical protein
MPQKLRSAGIEAVFSTMGREDLQDGIKAKEVL